MHCFSQSPSESQQFQAGSLFLLERVKGRCVVGTTETREAVASPAKPSPVPVPLQGGARGWCGIFQRSWLGCYSIRELGSQNVTLLFRKIQNKAQRKLLLKEASRGVYQGRRCQESSLSRKTETNSSQEANGGEAPFPELSKERMNCRNARTGEERLHGAKGETLPPAVPAHAADDQNQEKGRQTPSSHKAACCSNALCKCLYALFVSVVEGIQHAVICETEARVQAGCINSNSSPLLAG